MKGFNSMIMVGRRRFNVASGPTGFSEAELPR